MTGRDLKIAVMRTDHLGDMVLTTPLARAFHSGGASVTVFGPGRWEAVWKSNPHAGHVSLDQFQGTPARFVTGLARRLRAGRFSHAVVPHHDSRLFFAALAAGIPRRYCHFGGISGRMALFHCIRSGLNSKPRHFSDVWMDAARRLGFDGSEQPELFLDPAETGRARDLLSSMLPGASPLLIVAPFHGGNSCNLPPARYSAIAARMAETCRVLVVGTAAEKELWPPAPHSPNLRASFGELPLRSVMAAIACADSLFCGSTGPLHIARALGTPSVTVFGPRPANAAVMWRNPNVNAETLTSPATGPCPCGHGGRCVLADTPTDDEIIAAIRRSIGRGRPGRSGESG